jgi:hypothetical protein
VDKNKRIVGILLAVFALAGIGTWAWRTFGGSNPQAVSGGDIPSTAKAVVYYFRTNYRCMTCMKFEKYTGEALSASFAEPMSRGELIFKTVNVEEAGNEHFVDDYQLKTKSVVLVASGKKPRWKNLDKIWDEVRSEVGYKQYIRTEVTSFLAGGS